MPDIIELDSSGTLREADAQKAAAAGKSCRVVAFPTESSYAIGSTGLIKAATRRILQIKERSTLKPLAVLVDSTVAAKTWVEWTPLAQALATRFWPGPLLLLLKPTAQGRLLTFPEYPVVAIRVPDHPAARAMIKASGIPWVYSSANKSGQSAHNDAGAVEAELGAELDLVIRGKADAGEPTVVDATGEKPRVLKVGLLSAELIAQHGGSHAANPR
ncbi:MAG: L-threonylcarbamoyladenylate synthase [Elusimicrobiota bacterium]